MNDDLGHDFARRLDLAFGDEPPQTPGTDDLHRGRRRLRRRRVAAGVTSCAAVAALAGIVTVLGALPGDRPDGVPEMSTPDTAQIVDLCISARHVTDSTFGPTPGTEVVRRELAGATVMTSASSRYETVATLRSGNGRKYADCRLGRHAGYGTSVSIYPATNHLEPRPGGGTPVYEPPSDNVGPATGSAAGTEPEVWVPCPATAREESAAYYRELAGCDRFTVTWNDRRVPDVARARIVTPDGRVSWADVRDGYLSFAYVGRMTPAMAGQIRDFRPSRSTPWPAVRSVTFYDAEGRMLVRDRAVGTGDPDSDGLSIRNYPSLAWWTDHEG